MSTPLTGMPAAPRTTDPKSASDDRPYSRNGFSSAASLASTCSFLKGSGADRPMSVPSRETAQRNAAVADIANSPSGPRADIASAPSSPCRPSS
jgi:hypothetical protein